MNIEINQEVIVVGIGNNTRYSTPMYKAVVTKIGRKWFEVDTGDYVGEREKFSLVDGKCDGGNYMPEWQVYVSEEFYNEEMETPKLRNEIASKIYKADYKTLKQILEIL